MSFTDRDKKILLALVPIVVLVGYWFLLLSPKRDAASTAAEELTTQEQRRDNAQAAVNSAKAAKTEFAADYAQIVRLGKAIPAQVDMPSVVLQLDAAAAGTGIHFTKIATGERQGAPAATTPPSTGSDPGAGTPAAAGGQPAQSAPGAAAESANNAEQTADQRNAAAQQSGVSASDTQTSASTEGGLPVGGGATAAGGASASSTAPAGLETVPLELEFVGNFFNLTDFFHGIKRFVRVANDNVVVSGRLITIEGVRWSSDPEIFPRIRAELTATIYLSPKAQGTTAGASPTAPAPSTPASSTTPAESAPAPAAAPTATATP